ncbi:hypothetical protein LAZ67_5003849 [Cordylochernes scorpioides]|uniref:Ig-like domain-containing protein n=1 Tax=Cordylochernes scorpioides TaxID=51811 RepID=A0ABY6KIL4_9ARAC|nr:hypothetical protein LAZ67_5003849 [Cordylochernes scorpioides]
MLEMTRTDPEWKDKIITGDETWVYDYDPETKRQSAEWRGQEPPVASRQDLTIVVPAGRPVVLPCDVRSSPPVYAAWYRDHTRLRRPPGPLRIRSTRPGDSGRYVCRVVNGFGQAEAAVTLVVLGPDSDNITAEHPTAPRPIVSGALPSTSCQQNPDPPDVEKYTEFQGTGSAPDLPRTRSGRIIKKPVRFKEQ